MKFEKINCGGGTAAVVVSDSRVIVDVDSALDLLMSAKYEAGTKYIAVDKKVIAEEFFVLSSGLAGGNSSKIYQLRRKDCDIRRFFPLHKQTAQRLYP